MPLLHRIKNIIYLPPRLHVAYHHKAKDSLYPTVVFLHGIGSSSASWTSISRKLSPDVEAVTIDLLGFGDSPKVDWADYNASQHAVALEQTLRKLHITKNIIIVGHSLGALIAIEYARKHPKKVRHLLLCSPPFYQPVRRKNGTYSAKDEAYRRLYRFVRSNKSSLLIIAKLFNNYVSLNRGRRITKEILPAYVKSLESSIENQQSYKHIQKLRISVDIIYGKFDVLLITKNLQHVAEVNKKHVTLHSVASGHEIVGLYKTMVSKLLGSTLATYRAQDHTK